MKRSPRILLVEDNEAHADLALHYLRQGLSDGVEVDRVSRLDAALASARELPYRLILLDLSLPDSGLMETVASLSDLCRAFVAPVVAMTSLDDPETAEKVCAAGAFGCVSKMAYASGGLVNAVVTVLEQESARSIEESL